MARSFSGTNLIDCGSAATLDSLAPGPISGCAWIFRTTSSGSRRILFKMTFGFATGWTFALETTNRLAYVEKRVTTYRQQYSVDNHIALDIWTFVAFTAISSLLASDVHLYSAVGASALAEVTYNASADGVGAYVDDAAESLVIGNNIDGSEPFVGRLAEVRVWNRVLTTGEFEQVRRNSGLALGARGNWPLWGVASPEPDLSGNGNHGTVTGAVLAGHSPTGRYVPYRVKMPLGGQTISALDVESVGSAKNVLRWTDGSGGVHTNTVQRSTDDATWSDLATVAAGVTTYTDSTPSSKTRYYYRVKTIN